MPDSSGHIAIVGMAGRFPGARDLDEFWRNLREGRESISFFSEEELRAAGVSEASLADPRYVRAKGYLEDAELFDADYFGFSARQAEILDPQQRLFLEVAVEAMESAGCDSRRFAGAIGIFGGVSINTYLMMNLYPRQDLIDLVGLNTAFTSNRTDHLATRVAYALDLHGPAVTVQCACSTSLVAVHLACNALLQGECDAALAGGVTVSTPRKAGYVHRDGGILSSDGHCRAFDARAEGTIGGEGAGMVVLKRLEDAVASGDTIHAVIRGSAINNDGAVKVGYTAPSVDGQAAVIGEAQAVAGVHPDTVTYVEAHGTGTPLGDPIEIAALTRAFRSATAKPNRCGLGSVKTNIGHLDAAAGVAGLIKATLALYHRELPPSLHWQEANPEIDFANSPFYVNTILRSWERQADGGPRRAGVSAFGFGGTNCHVVLEEPPPKQEGGSSREQQLILLSAHSLASLDAMTGRLVSALRSREDISLPDVAFTLASGRARHRHRRIVACRDVSECIDLLTRLDPRRVFTGEAIQQSRHGLVFLFPGQGSQHPGMGQDLYRHEDVFRQAMDRCFEVIEAQFGEDARDVIWNRDAEERLRSTEWAQCSLFSIEWSLAQLWRSWGIEPACMIGHSVGEYVAACLAGVMEMEEALRLVILRGRLMQQMPPGSMMSIPLPEAEVRSSLERIDPRGVRIALAAVNGPSLCVVSGLPEAVDELEQQLSKTADVGCRRLHVSHAFHSPMMDPILAEFGKAVARVKLRAPLLPWVSNLTGNWIAKQEAIDPDYWVRHLRGTVRFADGLALVLKDSAEPLVEVGPGQALRTLARWHPEKAAGRLVVSSLPAANVVESENLHLRTTLGRLWIAGVELDQERYFANERRLRIPLPAYPFDRKRYWVDPPAASMRAPQVGSRRAPFEQWFHVPAWRRAPLPGSAAEAGSGKTAWLILADRHGIAERLERRIRARGETVLVEYFDSDHHAPEHYRQLLDELATYEGAYRIVHLTSLAGGEKSSEAVLKRGFYSVLHLAQALGTLKQNDGVDLLVASHGVCDLTGVEPLYPEQAAILGPCRVIPRENPRVRCRSIDLVLPEQAASDAEWERLSAQLLAEALVTDGERAVAYRGSQRWVEGYQRLAPAPRAPDLKTLVRAGGVYLITGGSGGIGLEIAALLAQVPDVRIVLIGRTRLPEREKWSGILADSGDTRIGRSIRRIRDLENVVELRMLVADVTDQAQMVAAVDRVRKDYGRIDGVVHAAGVPGGGIIQLKTDASAGAVLAPKVRGASVLCSIFEGAPLDFLVFCSARGALFGTLGQVDYSAANAYLDTLAHSLARSGDTHVVSIDWPGWKDVGMLVDAVRGDDAEPHPDKMEAVAHPLFDRKAWIGRERCDYFTRFSPESHWALDEHRIFGTPVIPGTAYLEMARAALKEFIGATAIELRDVFFLRPVVIRDKQQRTLRGTMRSAKDSATFTFSSRRDGNDATWEDICIGSAQRLESSEAPIHDIEAWLARCTHDEVIQTSESPIQDDNGPRWRSLRRVCLGIGELVARFELPTDFVADLDSFGLHPALLDRVNLTAREYLAGTLAARNFYLPFAYRRLTIRAPLPKTFWAYIRFKARDEEQSDETITFDTVIVDDAGRELVSVSEFTQKRVVAVTEQMRIFAGEELPSERDSSKDQRASVHERALREGISPEEGAAAFARILAARGLPQVVVSPTDLLEELAAREAPESQGGLPKGIEAPQPIETTRHPRPNLPTAYRAPRSPLERSMVTTWEDLLGVVPIGIDDNFFELGGDSVQGIQLVIRHREAGVAVSQQHIFQNQTIGELAAVLERELGAAATTAAIVLAPAQRWHIEEVGSPARAISIRCQAGPIVAEHLATALAAVRDHHVALRARLVRVDDAWMQEFIEPKESVPLTVRNLPADTIAAEDLRSQLRAALAASLDAQAGVMMSAALLRFGESEAELLLAIHELAADGASLVTVLEDLTSAYQQAVSGSAPRLRSRDATFPEWIDDVAKRAARIDPVRDLERWSRSEPGVNGSGNGQPSHASASPAAATVTRTLGTEDIGALEKLATHRRVSVEELVIAALSSRVAAHGAGGPLTLEIERSLRDESLSGLEVSRTVGPLHYAFPLVCDVLESDAAGRELWRHIKQHIRPAIRDGWRYALAHDFRASAVTSQALPGIAAPTLRVAFFGDLGVEVPGGKVVEIGWDALGPPNEMHRPVLRVFELNAVLHMQWEVDTSRIPLESVHAWADRLHDALRTAIDAGAGGEEVELAPSDFPLANIDEKALGRVADLLRRLDTSAES